MSDVEFDWSPDSLGEPLPKPVAPIGVIHNYEKKKKETWNERVLRMLYPLRDTVIQCSMCSLGRSACNRNNVVFDPHVFSNMCPSKFMVVGQNPGFNECLKGIPFIGDAGKFFDHRLRINGLSRQDFYISNVTKCYTINNEKPTSNYVNSCFPILQMEIKLLKPLLLITLGAVSFNAICPDLRMSNYLGKIVKSEKLGVKVFPIYHPSPRNMNIADRREKFVRDIALLCKLIKRLRQKHSG